MSTLKFSAHWEASITLRPKKMVGENSPSRLANEFYDENSNIPLTVASSKSYQAKGLFPDDLNKSKGNTNSFDVLCIEQRELDQSLNTIAIAKITQSPIQKQMSNRPINGR